MIELRSLRWGDGEIVWDYQSGPSAIPIIPQGKDSYNGRGGWSDARP